MSAEPQSALADRQASFTLDVMRPSDIALVAELERSAFRDPWPASLFRRELRLPQSKILLARSPSGEIVGYVCRWLTVDNVEIQNIAVAPRWRRQSIGRRLLGEVLEEARTAGVERALLEVRSGNEPALSLYYRFGFESKGRRRGYYDDGEDALLMELLLRRG